MKLNYKKVICVGFAFFLISMFWQVYDTVMAKILVDSFGLNQTWSGVIMALDNIIAVILLPVFGKLSDDTNTKWGKRTPYIVIGTVCAAALLVVLGIVENIQIKALSDANIPAVITHELQESNVIGGVLTIPIRISADSQELAMLGSGNNMINIGDSYFEYNGIFYLTKEVASAVRNVDVVNLRNNKIFILIIFIGVLFLLLLAMASFRTPAVSLMPDVTVKPLRSKANAIINLMGSAGGILSLGYMAILSKSYQTYIWVFIVTSVIMIIALAVFLITVNERKLVEQMRQDTVSYGLETKEEVEEENDKNVKEKMPKEVFRSFMLILFSVVFWYMAYNAATSKFAIYSTQVLNFDGYTLTLMVAQAAAIICYLPIGIISSKIGRKKTILIGVVELLLAFLIGSFITSKTLFLLYGVMALAGIGWATINVNSYPMVVEMSKGKNVGKYTGFYYTASMAAQIATPILSGFLMDIINLKVLFPYSVVFCALAFTTMMFVKHGDSQKIDGKKKTNKEIFEDTINALDD